MVTLHIALLFMSGSWSLQPSSIHFHWHLNSGFRIIPRFVILIPFYKCSLHIQKKKKKNLQNFHNIYSTLWAHKTCTHTSRLHTGYKGEKLSLIHGKSTNLGRMRVVRFLNQTNSCFPFIKAKWHHSVPHFTRRPSRCVHNFEQAQYDWDVCITLQFVCFYVCSGDGSRKHAFFRRKSEHRVSVPLGFYQLCGLLLVMFVGEVADQVPSFAPWQGLGVSVDFG